MARRHSRYAAAGRPRRRWAVFSVAALAVLGAGVWIAPSVLVLTPLRDRPLEAVFAGIDGSVSSGGARWNWLGSIEYRDILLRDCAGRAAVAVPRLVIDRGLVSLAFDPTDLGTVRLLGPEALVEVRPGGSSLEDILAPWLATFRQGGASGWVSFELEVVGAAVDFRDLVRQDAWRLSDVIAAGTIRSDAAIAGWTLAGRVRHAGQPRAAMDHPALPTNGGASDPLPGSDRLDRTTVAAGATAALARDGGFSVSSPLATDATGARTVALAAHRLPLGVSTVLATRFEATQIVDGLADIRLDATLAPTETRIAGTFGATHLAVCRADTLEELAAIERCDVPIDCSVAGDRLMVRKFAVESPLFRAEASGRIRLPTGGSWDWGEGLIEDDFAVAADLDLAAASRAIPGGLTVRPDVRVTDGRLQVAAASHADGDDRVLEIRVTSRDLAAVQSVIAATAATQERPLRWNEPFSAWLRGRRGPGGRLRIEDARISSPALELSASGDAEAATIQWTLDIDKLVAESAEVLDLGGITLAGGSRGRIDLSRADPAAAATVKVSASLSDFERTAPGRPAWRDKEITLEGEGVGRIAGGAAVVERAHAVLAAADDRLEATLSGGVVVGLNGLLGGRVAAPWLRAAAGAEAITADCSLTGDLGRWQARAAGIAPAVAAGGMELGGTIEAAVTVAARGAAWQITRAGGEIEKFSLRGGGRKISEPRVVATAAGLLHPDSGRIDISSGEILTTTLSVRTGGLSWFPGRRGDGQSDGDCTACLDRFRGKAQWRAHVARLEGWLVPADAAARWPATGELSGTVELVDTQAGLNLLVDATGTQLAVSSNGPGGSAGDRPPVASKPVWIEPRARLVLELTRPSGGRAEVRDRVGIERLGLESSTLALTARGGIADVSSRRLLELEGTAAYDWSQVSRLLTPWTRGRLRIAGAGTRPFAFRGPLGTALQATGPADATGQGDAPVEAALPLPDDWLSAARGLDPAAAERTARIARPVKAPDRSGRASLAALAHGLAVDTSAAWTAAEIDGFPIDAGEMPLRIVEGQLAFGPFDIGAGGGRLRGAPWIRLATQPAEFILPQGRVVDRVTLSGPFCDRWVAWLSPLLGHATHARGVVSVEAAGARLPLADPFGGDLAAQVIFEELEVTPAAMLEPLVNLLVKLQSVVDPRFAFGDKAVLLRVRPDPIRIRLVDRRLWHEGLVMDAGQLTVQSHGSVGADGTLAMVVEVALRGDIAGQTPVIAQLLRTPLAIPLKGTVQRPQFDAQSIDTLLGRIVENTAQAVLGDGLNRGLESLETLFGNPPPAGNPAVPPVSFPPAPPRGP
jgi:translocation and assembly module TamB